MENLKQRKRLRSLSSVAFWALLIIDRLVALVAPATTQSPAYLYGSLILFTFAVFAWVLLDSKIREVPVGPLFRVGIVAIAIVFVPIYIVKSRGWKGGFIGIAKFVGILVSIMVVLVAIGLASGRF